MPENRQAEAMQLGAQGYVVKGSLDWANLSLLIDKYACKTSGSPTSDEHEAVERQVERNASER